MLWEDGKRYPFEQRSVLIHDSLPIYLFIHLARFKVQKQLETYKIHKLRHDISFPNILDLAPYTTNKRSKSAKYEFLGMVEHQGHTPGAGHYISTVKTRGKDIFSINDSVVTKKGRVHPKGAYLILYKKK